MDKNEETLDPLYTLRGKISQKLPSEKPADDVLDDERSSPNAESQFVETTRQELSGANDAAAPPASESLTPQQDRQMPDTERVTEND